MFDLNIFVGWVIRGCELLIVLYLLLELRQKRMSLFFGGKRNLQSANDHEIHSCFLTALTVMLFHFIGSGFSQYILTFDMERAALIQFYYMAMLANSVAFALALFAAHLVRGCSFSFTSRACLYLTMLMGLVQSTQFVSHGLYDSSMFHSFYQYGVMLINLVCLGVVSMLPLRILGHKFKRKGAYE
ncbi:hypothetical protein [Pseudoalteromonas luteoviolacea]|uniref:hypothetical protein n=1 Tax=Pseudoalteromonas luteoviolacea TaxID=43657 RepID=UPI001150C3FE|nr:hypothetical protein [Pseudoalteromonas luteoviolacea]TQF70466.1 hypothetical protein FLM44_05060 [Pseudoalteromonas luteoviolacea]